MREIRTSGSEGGGVEYNRRSLPLSSLAWIPAGACPRAARSADPGAGMVTENNEFTLAKGRRDGQSAKSG